MTFRKRDSSVEQEISKFLDLNFYPKISKKTKRFTSKQDQLHGLDIEITLHDGQTILVDEKAASHYINKNLKTFAFELSFLNAKGDETQGWFLDSLKKTEYYMIMWIKADVEKSWWLTSEKITEVEALLIKRQTLINFLESINYPISKLQLANNRIRSEKRFHAIGKKKSPHLYFYCSPQLEEKPVNVIIDKKYLARIAEKKFVITPNQTKVLALDS